MVSRWKAVNAKVTGLTVSAPSQMSDAVVVEPWNRERSRAYVAKCLGKIEDAAARAGVSCNVVHVENEHPYRAIIDTANDKSCDLIVMASHGRRGISAIVLGSETVKVLTHSAIPVLVYRGSGSALFPAFFAAS
jgi:nucleotide-binding universal stress UspA family protein